MNSLFDGEKDLYYCTRKRRNNYNHALKKQGDEFSINPSKLLFFYKKGYAYQWDIKQSILWEPNDSIY